MFDERYADERNDNDGKDKSRDIVVEDQERGLVIPMCHLSPPQPFGI